MALAFKLALRRLRKSPATSVFAALALAVSVGTAGAAIVLMNAIVVRPLDVRAPDQLVSIAPMIGDAMLGIPGLTVAALSTSGAPICGYSRGALAVQLADRVTRRGHEAFSGRCYELLGVRPFLGRLITEQDAPLAGVSAAVAVLTHRFWQASFAADPDIVGKTLMVEGKPLTIIGVLPPSFTGLHVDQGPDLVIPLGLTSTLMNQPPRATALYAITRSSGPAAIEQLRRDLRGRWTAIWNATNPGDAARLSAAADPANLQVEPAARGISDLRKQYTVSLRSLVALALLLVMLASANVAALWIARAAHRATEFKTLAAIGASASRIVAILTAEAVLIAAVAALGAVGISLALTALIAQQLWIGFLPLTMRLAPTPAQLLAIALGATLLAFVLLAPATAVVLGHTRLALRSMGTGRHRWRSGLLSFQAAVTLPLVFAAMLLTRNLLDLQAINPGYQAEGLSWGRIDRISNGEKFDRRNYIEQVITSAARMTGVQGVAFSNTFPTTEVRHLSALMPVARASADVTVGVREFRVSPRFFATLGVPFLAGRDLRFDDDAGRAPVAVINRTLAERLFQADDPIGQFVTLVPSKRTVTIVGVVADFSPGDLRIRDLPAVYTPLLQETQTLGSSFVVIRARAPIAFAELSGVVGQGNHHYLNVYRPVRDHLLTLIGRERLLFSISTLLALLGILLGAAGVFATLVQAVSERAKELAIRSAIGAQHHRIISAVLSEVFVPLAAGVAIGVPLALLAVRAGAALYTQSPSDPGLLLVSIAALLAAASMAGIAPIVRALRLDPAVVLRE